MNYSENLDLADIVYLCEIDNLWKTEIWKTIVDFNNYQVSDLGRVKSLSRLVKCKSGFRRIKDIILKPHVDNYGYYKVAIYNGKKATFKIHKLVSIAFLNHKPCGMKLVINHKNFNRLDSNIYNLEITTQRKNADQKHLHSKSKYIGVSLVGTKYRATIIVDSKQIHLGYFDTEEEASGYYEKALIAVENGSKIKVKKAHFSSKYKGVYWDSNRRKWKAEVKLNNKQNYLGRFVKEYDAYLACKKFLKETVLVKSN